MSYPKTADEWWKLLEENKEALRDMVGTYHPVAIRRGIAKTEAEISAPKAEVACQAIREEIAKESAGLDPVDAFDKAVEVKDGMMMDRLLSATWFGLPESMSSRYLPGFHALCDLCSENHCIYEESDHA